MLQAIERVPGVGGEEPRHVLRLGQQRTVPENPGEELDQPLPLPVRERPGVRRRLPEGRLVHAKGELVTVPAADVETLRPQRASLMPEGLLKDLTLDEAADLLAYLEGLTG